jgi:hypothetical protein
VASTTGFVTPGQAKEKGSKGELDMSNKSRDGKPMVPINLHVDGKVSALAERLAKERRVSKAQVLREWLDLGMTHDKIRRRV